jgi:hypothetical protein
MLYVSNSSGVGAPASGLLKDFFIFVFVGTNGLTITQYFTLNSASNTTFVQYAPVELVVLDNSAGCGANYIQGGSGCTGLSSAHNPHMDAQGIATLVGQTSGISYQARATYCGNVCGNTNSWHFTCWVAMSGAANTSCLLPNAETYTCSGVFGDSSDYKTFTCSNITLTTSASAQWRQPIGLYGASNLQALATKGDGRMRWPIGRQIHPGTVSVGDGFNHSAHVTYNAQEGFYGFEQSNMVESDGLFASARSEVHWAASLSGDDLYATTQDFAPIIWQGCVNNSSGGFAGGASCQPGTIALVAPFPTQPAPYVLDKYTTSWTQEMGFFTQLANAGEHTMIGFPAVCVTDSTVLPINCDVLSNPTRVIEYLQALRILEDGVPHDIWSLDASEQGSASTPYFNTVTTWIHMWGRLTNASSYPTSCVAPGCPDTASDHLYSLDVGFPPLTLAGSLQSNLSTNILATKPALGQEGGGNCSATPSGSPQDDHGTNGNEFIRVNIWRQWLSGQSAAFWLTGGGMGYPCNNNGLQNTFLGSEEHIWFMHFQDFLYDFDGAASPITGTYSCSGITLNSGGYASTRDVAFWIFDTTSNPRVTHSGCTITITLPAANMQGEWYDTNTGAAVGTVTVSGSGSQTINIPNTFKDELVLRLRSTAIGPFIRTSMQQNCLISTSCTLTTLVTQGGSSPYTYKVVEGCSIPGMTLNLTSGAWSGTPTLAGTYWCGVKAMDSAVPFLTSPEQLFRITVFPALAWVDSKGGGGQNLIESNSNGGTANLTVLNLYGGFPPVGPCTYGAGFVNTAVTAWGTMGAWKGPGSIGTDTVALTCTDALGNMATTNVTLTLKSPSTSIPNSWDGFTVERTVFYQRKLPILTSDGTGVSCSITSGSLPTGLTISTPATSNICVVSGTVTNSAGSVGPFTITKSDSLGGSAQTVTWTVVDPITIATTTLAQGAIGVNYAQPINVTGGLNPTCRIAPLDTLPPGIFFEQRSHELYGVPQSTISSVFTVLCEDVLGGTSSQQLTLAINPQLTNPNQTLPDNATSAGNQVN